MCLYAKNQKLIAETDIVCYKVLQSLNGLLDEIGRGRVEECKDNGIEYLTPYNYFPMEFGETYDCERKEREIRDWYSRFNTEYVRILGGFIHTFATIDDALFAISDCDMYGAVIVKSIIPKGTEYYQGSMHTKDRDRISSYASRVMVLGGEDDIVATTDEKDVEGKDDVTLNYNGKKYVYKCGDGFFDEVWGWYETGEEGKKLTF